MSEKKDKANRKAEAAKAPQPPPEEPKPPVTRKQLVQAHARRRACEDAHEQLVGQAKAAVAKSGVRLQAARNEEDELNARAAEEDKAK